VTWPHVKYIYALFAARRSSKDEDVDELWQFKLDNPDISFRRQECHD
jgi:hypothetical protein